MALASGYVELNGLSGPIVVNAQHVAAVQPASGAYVNLVLVSGAIVTVQGSVATLPALLGWEAS